MSRLSIRFLTPNLVTEVDEDELEILRKELIRVADGAPRLAAASTLADALDSFKRLAAFEPNSTQRFALLRATDHLRNLDHRGELLTLRDRLVGTGGVRPIPYQLRFLDGRTQQSFTSYSLAYEPGDRLVTPAKTELRVISVEEEGAELVVREWTPLDEEPA